MAIGTKELLATLKIDPEFAGKIPPLTDAEFAQLRENILEVGEVYEPIRLWNGTVVDGHNRLKVIRENPDVKWSTRDMVFADKWAAFEWMYRNQLGRRNLSDENRTYCIGKMYEARKNTVGAQTGNKNAEKQMSQNATVDSKARTPRTDEIVGKELGVNHATVARSYKFAKGVDAIREVSQEAADKVLSGKSMAKKQDIAAAASASLEQRQQAAAEILQGKRPSAMTEKKTPDRNKAKADATPMETLPNLPITDVSLAAYVSEPSTYNIDNFIEEVRMQCDDFMRSIRMHIETRFSALDSATARMKLRRELSIIKEGLTILEEELR